MQPGDRIDRYVVERVLGSGGFGTVYRAKHAFTDRAVALKVLRQDRDGAPHLLERFLQEARASAAVGSPHIVQVLDAGLSETGGAFLAMELLEGEDLSAYLARAGKLGPEETVRIGRELLAGLGAAHARDIVHRDLKPANVFLARRADGTTQVKILDFGISKMRVPGRMDGLTRTGMVLGTPSYMSPEQFRGARDVDGRADLYSVAVILYEMLSGRVPFDAESYETLILKIFSEPPIPLARVAPEVPVPLVYVVERGLARDPDARWQTADDLSSALDAALRGESPLAASPSTARTRDRDTGPMSGPRAPSTPPTRVWSQSAEPSPQTPSTPALGPVPVATPQPLRTEALAGPSAAQAVSVQERRSRGPRWVAIGAGALLAAGLAGGVVVAMLSLIGGQGDVQPTYGVAPAAPATAAPVEQVPTAAPKTPLPEPEVEEAGETEPAGVPATIARTKRPRQPRSSAPDPAPADTTPADEAPAPRREPPALPDSITGVRTRVEVLSPNIDRNGAARVAQRAARNVRMQHCRRATDHEVRVQVLVGLEGRINIAQPDPTRAHGDSEVARCVALVVRDSGPLEGTEMGGIFYVIADLRAR